MTELLPQLITAIGLGLLGSGHCLGMCGGIAAASGSANNSHSVLFSLGRIFSYALIGTALGGMVQIIGSNMAPFMLVMRITAGLLLIAMGLYMGNWWLGLLQLERLGQKLWRLVQPISKQFLPINTPAKAIKLGLLWGLLPCGLIYSTLTWAAASGNAAHAGLLMLAFGVGTLPAMISVSFASKAVQQIMQQQTTRKVGAVLLILFGLWTAYIPISHWHMHQSVDPSATSDSQHHHHH